MILVFGRTGQVARELARLAPDAVFLCRDLADLSDPLSCVERIRFHAPDAVINAAGFTAVDQAEAEEELANRINGDAPYWMARTCAELNIPMVQISTDYVFDGSGTTPFAPGDCTAPLGAYGRSKLKGEEGVRKAQAVHAVLRTSWVFSPYGKNFVNTMLRLGAERESLTVVADQIGAPTSARSIAGAVASIAKQLCASPEKAGTYHFAGQPAVSWADFARTIMQEADLRCKIVDISTSAYPTPARRPLNSRLDCTDLAVFGLSQPSWRADLITTLSELKGQV